MLRPSLCDEQAATCPGYPAACDGCRGHYASTVTVPRAPGRVSYRWDPDLQQLVEVAPRGPLTSRDRITAEFKP